MYKISIKDKDGKNVKGILDARAPAANYFAGCVWLAVDLLSGGPAFIERMRSVDSSKEALTPAACRQMALVMFVTSLHDHPFFDVRSKGMLPDDPNYGFYMKLGSLLRKPITDTSVQSDFLKILSSAEVPGISEIKVTDMSVSLKATLYGGMFKSEDKPDGSGKADRCSP